METNPDLICTCREYFWPLALIFSLSVLGIGVIIGVGAATILIKENSIETFNDYNHE